MRTLKNRGHRAIGLDVLPSPFTSVVGSITSRSVLRESLRGMDAVIHAATLHKPHVVTHTHQDFIDTNITGTLNLLEESAQSGVARFIYTSTTSVFGRALLPPEVGPATWVTEELRPVPKNIYGVTKAAAEDLCELSYRRHGLPCIVLRIARFFPEIDDDAKLRQEYDAVNLKVNEYLNRRVDLEDVVDAHLQALKMAPLIGFARYIVSSTSPFDQSDVVDLRNHAADVVRKRVPEYEAEYTRRSWKMFSGIDRVYVNHRARRELGWEPQYNFRRIIERLGAGEDLGSQLARDVGSKGYHVGRFVDGPYPVS